MSDIRGPERKPWINGRIENLIVDGGISAGSFNAQDVDFINLNVQGTSNLIGDVTAGRDILATRNIRARQDLQADRDFDVYGEIFLRGDAEIAGTLAVDGNTTLNRNLTVNRDAQVAGTLAITGKASFVGEVEIDGKTTINDDLDVEEILNAKKDVNIIGVLDVTGQSDLSDVVIGGTTICSGILQANSDINAFGNVIVDLDLTVRNDLAVYENAVFDKDVVIDGTLEVGGYDVLNQPYLLLDEIEDILSSGGTGAPADNSIEIEDSATGILQYFYEPTTMETKMKLISPLKVKELADAAIVAQNNCGRRNWRRSL